MSENASDKKLPHQWVDKDGYVLIVKCLNADGTGYKGFVWPKAGPVKPEKWSREATCDSSGLFGWAWGFGCGEGKDPNACNPWLVFRAKPQNVIDVYGKVKAVPAENGDLPEVVYYGTQAGAMSFTMFGRVQFVIAQASGSASATGDSGSASATGDSGSASATGEYGVAISTGIESKAKGAKGTWLVLSEWHEKTRWERVSVKTVKVDGKKIKADTFYQLKNGKFSRVRSYQVTNGIRRGKPEKACAAELKAAIVLVVALTGSKETVVSDVENAIG